MNFFTQGSVNPREAERCNFIRLVGEETHGQSMMGQYEYKLNVKDDRTQENMQ